MERKLVLRDVYGRDVSPITIDMTSKKFPRLLARFFKRGQRTGASDYMTECEERLHALLFSASTA